MTREGSAESSIDVVQKESVEPLLTIEMYAQTRSAGMDFEDRMWGISRPELLVYENDDADDADDDDDDDDDDVVDPTIALKYTVSDFMLDYMVHFQMMTGERCETDITSNNYLTPTLVFDEATPAGDGSGKRTVYFVLTPNKELLFESPIIYHQRPKSEDLGTDEGQDDAMFTFCNRLSVHSSKGVMVNWLDLRLTMRWKASSAEGLKFRSLLPSTESTSTMSKRRKEEVVSSSLAVDHQAPRRYLRSREFPRN